MFVSCAGARGDPYFGRALVGLDLVPFVVAAAASRLLEDAGCWVESELVFGERRRFKSCPRYEEDPWDTHISRGLSRA